MSPWNGQPRGRDVLISSFLQPSTGGQGLDVSLNKGTYIQAEGQGSPTQAIMYRQYPFSEQKQRKAKVKVKETDPTCSQICLLATGS